MAQLFQSGPQKRAKGSAIERFKKRIAEIDLMAGGGDFKVDKLGGWVTTLEGIQKDYTAARTEAATSFGFNPQTGLLSTALLSLSQLNSKIAELLEKQIEAPEIYSAYETALSRAIKELGDLEKAMKKPT